MRRGRLECLLEVLINSFPLKIIRVTFSLVVSESRIANLVAISYNSNIFKNSALKFFTISIYPFLCSIQQPAQVSKIPNLFLRRYHLRRSYKNVKQMYLR